MAKKKEIDWQEIKELYIQSDRYSLRELADKFGVAYSSVKRHSSQGKWSGQRQKNIEKAKAKIEEAQVEIVQTEKIEEFAYREKINEIASKLLSRIASAIEFTEKPTGLANLAGALKDLVGVLRENNNEPTITEQRAYVLAQKKLALEEAKLKTVGMDDNESGVVLLPEIAEEEAAE